MKVFSAIKFIDDIINDNDYMFVVDLWIDLNVNQEESMIVKYQGLTANDLLERELDVYKATMIDDIDLKVKTSNQLIKYIEKKSFDDIEKEHPNLIKLAKLQTKEIMEKENEKRNNQELH